MRKIAIRDLGEIALRVKHLESMQRFYEEVIGLQVMKKFPDAVFFEVADGYAGHTHILVLFDRSSQPDYSGLDPEKSTVDHVAFEISLSDYEAEKLRIEQHGVKVLTKEFPNFHWRSLFLEDPEGNTVEFVCYDETV